ncbi:MAG: hypothetical protein FWD70_07335 [Desulfuromonadales bacterium]|nr:hypothetical protein [Desulfuromonadales bacterium]
MTLENKATLFKSMDLKKERVNVNGQEVVISEITSSDYMKVFNNPYVKKESGELDGHKFVALLLTYSIIDNKGERILSDDDAEDLRNISSTAFVVLAETVKKLNGITGEEIKN